jgi:predicted permease
LPGVQSATLADFSPLSFSIHSDPVMPEGYVLRPHENIEADRASVGTDYLSTLRTTLTAGRDFTTADTADTQRVIIVNQAMVDRYWPGQNAIGKRLQVSGRWWTVVGVAANAKYRRLIYDPTPMVVMPLTQRYQEELTLHVRTKGDALAMAPSVESAVHSLKSNLPLYHVSTLTENMRLGSVFERIAVAFATSFGVLALLLAAVGLYGVVAYTTRQRTREIGIRVALGAGKANIFRDVILHGLRLTFAGLLCGLIASLFLTRFVRTLLFGVTATDWLTFSLVSALLCVVALVACFVPARRAASVDPMEALRSE